MGGFTKVDNRALKLFGPGSMERAVYLQMCSEAEYNGPTEKWSQGVSVPLNNGQLIFGRRAWAEKFGVSEGVIRGVVDRLLATNLINQMRTGKNCVVTITYLYNEPSANRSRTANEPPINPISNTEDSRQKTNTLPSGNGRAAEKGKPASKGSRWIEGTTLPEDWLEWAKENTDHTEIGIQAQFEQFSDYWIAQPGQKGLKANWFATWKNWLRRSFNQPGHQPARPAAPRAFAQ